MKAKLLLASLAVAAIGLIAAAGASAAAPQNTASPAISGNAREGQTLTEARALPVTRHLAVTVAACAAFSRHWLLLPRFRSSGRLLVTMRASSHGQLSTLAARSLLMR